MSMLNGRKAYLPLEEGKAYTVVLLGYKERESEERTENFYGYIDFKWELTDDKRIVNDSRSCPVGTDILARQVLEQLNSKALNSIDQADLFNILIENQTPLKMWVSRNTVNTIAYTNYGFQEPAKLPTIGGITATKTAKATVVTESLDLPQ